MQDFQNILAALQDAAQAPRLLNKLHRLTAEQDCDVSVVRVVYEGLADLRSKRVDVSAELKELVLSAARDTLRDTIETTGIDVPNLTSAAMWNPRVWEGIVHAAQSMGADLIVKTCESGPAGALRTPDDWNLLRHADVPVLLTHPRAWSPAPTIVAAIDVYDPEHDELNGRILDSARHLAHQLGGELHLASVFPVLSTWLDEVTSMQSYTKLRKEVEAEVFEELGEFAAKVNLADYRPHAIEGTPVEAMRNLIGLLDAEIVVVGTKARTGVSGLVLGNTAEKLLHALDCDVLTVP